MLDNGTPVEAAIKRSLFAVLYRVFRQRADAFRPISAPLKLQPRGRGAELALPFRISRKDTTCSGALRAFAASRPDCARL
eukprot:scaffold7966_cov277-Pinguiococcus_pyrenoidosus.AAC.1